MSDVDPRYDPRFQRGFDPVPPSAPHPMDAPTRPPVAAAPDPVDLRQEAPQPLTPARATDPVADVADLDAEPPAVDRLARFAVIALPIVSLAMIAIGIALVAWTVQLTIASAGGSGVAFQSYLAPQTFTNALAPALLTAGMIGLVVWIAVLALRRRRA